MPTPATPPFSFEPRGARPASARLAGDSQRRSRWRALCLLVLLLGTGLGSAAALADSQDERRVRTAARLFRALLAADVGIERKVDAEGRLDVAIYSPDTATAERVAALIVPPDAAAPVSVRGLPLQLRHIDGLGEETAPPIALFLATPLANAELDRLVGWSIRHQVILYSPFEGDVERGALAGLAIGAKVQPYLNQRSLSASKVELKPFFLRVAKVYP
jgi:hypothetical protein